MYKISKVNSIYNPYKYPYKISKVKVSIILIIFKYDIILYL